MEGLKKQFFRFLPHLVCLFLLVDFYLIFVHATEEKTQGLVQKIFYFHVSSAFAMYAGFLIAGATSLAYLVFRDSKWDFYSQAGTEVGLVFCTMVLMSGPIWAKPIWGDWWTWDPRLTTTLMIWLIFFSTLILRRFFGLDARGRVIASGLTLFGILDIPLIFFSVKLWRGVHPSVLGAENNMPLDMKLTLIFTNITVLVLFGVLYSLRVRLLKLEEKIIRLSLS